MLFGLTRGEIALIAFIFALVYSAGLLPKLAAWLAGRHGTTPRGPDPGPAKQRGDEP